MVRWLTALFFLVYRLDCTQIQFLHHVGDEIRQVIGFRVLAAGNQPDFRTMADFRKQHVAALQGLFDQVLQIALQAGR
jgi:hypothetical protein